MANISIRNIDAGIKQALQRRAAREGCSMEALLRQMLRHAAEQGAAAAPEAAAPAVAAGQGGALSGRRILLIIGGSIAAYKALEFIRLARRQGAQMRAVMTAAAQQFITPLAVGALTGGAVATELFVRESDQDIGHIRLARNADMIVFVGVSASRLAKLAAGLGDDLAGAIMLAARAPVLLAPGMNPAMWAHPATQRNVAQLRADGLHFIGPEAGEMAESGEAGLGRMSEPAAILAAAENILAGSAAEQEAVFAFGKNRERKEEGAVFAGRPACGKNGEEKQYGVPLAGRHIIITAGPTHEPLDPVRYLANRSSGRQGYALAAACLALGARVSLISGPVNLAAPPGAELVKVQTARQMQAAAAAALPADAAIFAAAVADWRPSKVKSDKIKKAADDKTPPPLELVENPDILAEIGHSARRPQLVIGFAAETANLLQNAQAKLAKKGADWIIANNVATQADGRSVMGGADNQIFLLSRSGIEEWPQLPKKQVAARIAARIADFFLRQDKSAAAKETANKSSAGV